MGEQRIAASQREFDQVREQQQELVYGSKQVLDNDLEEDQDIQAQLEEDYRVTQDSIKNFYSRNDVIRDKMRSQLGGNSLKGKSPDDVAFWKITSKLHSRIFAKKYPDMCKDAEY